jgi:Protein of unknown function (DUF3800)
MDPVRSSSNYIVYADESGDHGLESINSEYPIFVLSFCIFAKDEYRNVVMPAVTGLKFDYFGHDMVVLHEHDIRKRLGAFSGMNKESRSLFMALLTSIIQDAKFTLVGIVVDKKKLCNLHGTPKNPYHTAMRLGLERVASFLSALNDGQSDTFVVFERRGKREDIELELEFHRICAGANALGTALPLKCAFASKLANSTGLQFADMTARPMGMKYLRPEQENRAYSSLLGKFHRGTETNETTGFTSFP